ncbi:MAG: leucine-rich repeat protein [Muribaculaceae bacterium]|nr:leucine-rich repeat protein [Muribaculaceae bacterium]
MKRQILISLMLLAVITTAHAYDFMVNSIAYNINSNNQSVSVTNVDFSGTSYSGDIVIPEEVAYSGKTYPVTGIGMSAFSWATEVTSVSMPNTITNLGTYSFLGATGIKSIKIPESVITIDTDAFRSCAFTEVVIPNNVTNIGNGAFSENENLKKVVIGNSVTHIGMEAFARCKSLTSVNIPASVTYLGETIFDDCTSLPAIVIPEGITSLSFAMFSGCHALSEVTLPSTLTKIGNYAFSLCKGLKAIDLPSSVSSIGSGAFSGCTSLESITIPDKVKVIERGTFKKCSSLESLTIPQNVQKVETEVFEECTSLKSVFSKNPTPPSLNVNAVPWQMYEKLTLYVPRGCYDKYAVAENWKHFRYIYEDETSAVGDVDGNGVVDISDVNIALNIVLDKASANDYLAADVNLDGTVDISDVNAITNFVLNGTDIAYIPDALYIRNDGDTDYKQMIPVYGQPGLFWRIFYVNEKGAEISPLNGFNKISFTKMHVDEASDMCAVVDNGKHGFKLEYGAGRYLVIMNCEIVNGEMKYTLTLNNPIVRLMGTTTPKASWDENEEGCQFTEYPREFYSPELARDADPDSGVRMYVKIPGHDWWHSEFVPLNGKIEYRGNGMDQERVAGKAGQRVYLNFDTDTGRVE